MTGKSKLKYNSYLTYGERFLNILLNVVIILTLFLSFLGLSSYFFNYHMKYIRKSYINVTHLFINNISIFMGISSVIASVCLAIFPILLSLDSDSLLSKIKYNDELSIIKKIITVLIFSSLSILFPLFKNKNIYIQLFLLIYDSLLIESFLKVYLGLYIMLIQDLKYRHDSIIKNEKDKKYIFSLIERIYNNQNK